MAGLGSVFRTGTLFGAAALALAITDANGQDFARSAPLSEVLSRDSRMVEAGAYTLAGRSVSCGRARTLISPYFYDYGGALPGLIIVNPEKMAKLSSTAQLFVYAHECGHQYVGRDEAAADCFAIRQGKSEGWLQPSHLKGICNALFADSKGDAFHPPGARRCAMMEACYASAPAVPARVVDVPPSSGQAATLRTRVDRRDMGVQR